MFKQATSPTFWHPVKVDFTAEDGRQRTVEFDVKFKRLKIEEARAKAKENEGNDDADLLFLQAVVEDWKRVPGDDGDEVPFSPEALQELYSIGFGAPVVATYFRALPQAKQKN